MKNATVFLIVMTLLAFGVPVAAEEEAPIDKAFEVCKPEIEAYCSQVTLGGGRMLACFYAHEDKLSGSCTWALYEAAGELEEFIAAVSHLANQCWDDLVEHCGEVEMGEGRVATCLLEHEKEVSEPCRKAIDDVDLQFTEE
jgi:hypothetical protein